MIAAVCIRYLAKSWLLSSWGPKISWKISVRLCLLVQTWSIRILVLMFLNWSPAPAGPLRRLLLPAYSSYCLWVKWRRTSFLFSSMQSRKRFSISILSEKVLACSLRIFFIFCFYWSSCDCIRTTWSSLCSSKARKKFTIYSLIVASFKFFWHKLSTASAMVGALSLFLTTFRS